MLKLKSKHLDFEKYPSRDFKVLDMFPRVTTAKKHGYFVKSERQFCKIGFNADSHYRSKEFFYRRIGLFSLYAR